MGRRQAEALADVCGYVLDHGDVPECGGHRPHLTVLIRLDDLEKRGDETGASNPCRRFLVSPPVSSLRRARAACLDFGGPVAPQALRMLCCDAAVVPVVMNGQGQPLDVGRATRSIPDGLRRAVAARDGGCAHPARPRSPTWPWCAACTTARSTPPTGPSASVTGSPSSSLPRGSIPTNAPDDEPCHTWWFDTPGRLGN